MSLFVLCFDAAVLSLRWLLRCLTACSAVQAAKALTGGQYLSNSAGHHLFLGGGAVRACQKLGWESHQVMRIPTKVCAAASSLSALAVHTGEVVAWLGVRHDGFCDGCVAVVDAFCHLCGT